MRCNEKRRGALLYLNSKTPFIPQFHDRHFSFTITQAFPLSFVPFCHCKPTAIRRLALPHSSEISTSPADSTALRHYPNTLSLISFSRIPCFTLPCFPLSSVLISLPSSRRLTTTTQQHHRPPPSCRRTLHGPPTARRARSLFFRPTALFPFSLPISAPTGHQLQPNTAAAATLITNLSPSLLISLN